jgi:hypothetical protein
MIPQVDIEQNSKKVPQPEIVWEGQDGREIFYRLIVKHFTSGNPPKALLEKCCKWDNMGGPIWLESDIKVPECVLRALAELASNDDKILEPKTIK